MVADRAEPRNDPVAEALPAEALKAAMREQVAAMLRGEELPERAGGWTANQILAEMRARRRASALDFSRWPDAAPIPPIAAHPATEP